MTNEFTTIIERYVEKQDEVNNLLPDLYDILQKLENSEIIINNREYTIIKIHLNKFSILGSSVEVFQTNYIKKWYKFCLSSKFYYIGDIYKGIKAGYIKLREKN